MKDWKCWKGWNERDYFRMSYDELKNRSLKDLRVANNLMAALINENKCLKLQNDIFRKRQAEIESSAEKPSSIYHFCPVSPSERLESSKFENTVVLKFEDGSVVKFRYAFVREREGQIDVYTEHCGYHSYFRLSVVSVKVYPNGLGSISVAKKAKSTGKRGQVGAKKGPSRGKKR